MNYNWDFYSACLLTIFVLVLAIIDAYKYKFKLNRFTSLVIAKWLGVAVFAGLELASFNKGTYFLVVERYYPVMFGFLHAFLLFQISFLSIAELNPKKMNVLWRLPLIGALLGLFPMAYHEIIHAIIFILIIFIYLKNKTRLALVSWLWLGSFIFMLGNLWIDEFGVWYINTLILWLILLTHKYWSHVYCKYLSYKEMTLK